MATKLQWPPGSMGKKWVEAAAKREEEIQRKFGGQLDQYSDPPGRVDGETDLQPATHLITSPALIRLVAKRLGLPPWPSGVLIYTPPSDYRPAETGTCPTCGQRITWYRVGKKPGGGDPFSVCTGNVLESLDRMGQIEWDW